MEHWADLLRNDRERALTRLYQRTFPMVLHHVKRNHGTTQDAKDVFHDALLLFYEKAVGNRLTLTASASTYLVGICRNLWLRELDRRRRVTHLNDQEPGTPECPITADEQEWDEENDIPLLEYVDRLGEKCKSVLLSFYYFRQTMDQIARAHQYRNVRSATVQKFKCLERLRKSVAGRLIETFR